MSMRYLETTVTILDGAQRSDALVLRGSTLLGFMPADPTNIVSYTFEISFDEGATWFPVQDAAGVAISVVCAEDQFAVLPKDTWGFAELLRFVGNAVQNDGTDDDIITCVLAAE